MAILRRFGTNTLSTAAGTAVGNVTSDALLPILQDLINTTWAQHQSLPLTPEQAAAAVERGEMSYAEAEAESKLSGIKSSRFKVLERLAGLAPATDQLVQLRRRGLIDDARMRRGFVQGNVRSEWSDVLAALAEQLLSTAELANMVVQNVMPEGEAAAAAAQVGVRAENFARLVKLAGNPIAPGEALTLWNRGDLNEDEVTLALRQSRLKPEWIEPFKKLRRHMPSPSDLIRFAVREVYSPEVTSRFGQFEDFPEQFATEAAKQGIEPEQARQYWAAHWELPSPQQGYAMLHRGLIGDAELQLLLRARDVMPFWREKLQQIAYLVPGRIDLRRMLQHEVITEADVLAGYKRIGYGDEDAKHLTAFAVELAHTTGKIATVTDEMTLYGGEQISRAEVIARLVKLGYKPDVATKKADLFDARFVVSARTAAVGDLHREYAKGNITDPAATAALGKLGIASWAVPKIVAAWHAFREAAEASAKA